MFSESDPKRLAQIALVVLLIIGCIAVLLPFIGAVLFAFVVWVCTWKLYAEQLLPRLGGRNTVGATLMTTLFVLVLLVPTIFLAASLANNADKLFDLARPHIEQGLPQHPPAWLSGMPLFGSEIEAFWHRIASNREELNALLRQMITPARQFLLALGGIAANGLLQLVLALFVMFFLYRDGEKLANALYRGEWDQPSLTGLEILESVLLFGKDAKNPHGPKIDSIPTKALRQGVCAEHMDDLNGLMERVADAIEAIDAIETIKTIEAR